ncbi:MAG: histidine phosphatase family protein [Planctomycetota bacterium]
MDDPLAHITRLGNRYLGLRHGESEANVAGIVLSDPAAGVPGYGLTARGRAQVQASVAASAGLDAATWIVCSDFRRARESAEEAAAVLGAGAPELRPALRERWFGAHEGQRNDRYEQVWARDREDPDHTEQGVESARAVARRVATLIVALERERQGATILLVSHGDALQLLQTALLRLSPGTHRERPHWGPGEVRPLELT